MLIKVGLADLPPLTFAGFRYTVAAVILLVLLASGRPNREAALAMSWRTRGMVVLLGVVLYALTQDAQFVGLSLLPAATLSLGPFAISVVRRNAGPGGHQQAQETGGIAQASRGAKAVRPPPSPIRSLLAAPSLVRT